MNGEKKRQEREVQQKKKDEAEDEGEKKRLEGRTRRVHRKRGY